MIEIKRILVPTDFSENAEHAYPYAKTLAAQFGAKILAAYVSDVSIYPVGPGQVPFGWETLESEVREYSDRKFVELRERFGPDCEVETVRREGTPFVELIALAREEQVDLIVVSTHGHTGVKHLLVGSTAEKLVRKAPCPVLTVHPGERDFVMP